MYTNICLTKDKIDTAVVSCFSSLSEDFDKLLDDRNSSTGMYKTDKNYCSGNKFIVDLLILLLRSSICVFLIATLFQIF